MPDDLYKRDVLVWSERQAALLGRVAAGERVNEAVDWANVIEEVRDLALSELHAVESLLEQALQHILKLQSRPDSPSVPRWRGETVSFLAGARRRFSPSMHNKIDLDDIFGTAWDAVREAYEQQSLAVPPVTCPWALDQFAGSETRPRRTDQMFACDPAGSVA